MQHPPLQPPGRPQPPKIELTPEMIERHLLAGRRFIHECAATNSFYQFQQIAHELYYDPEQPENRRFHLRCTAGGEKYTLWKSGDESVKELLERMPFDVNMFRIL